MNFNQLLTEIARGKPPITMQPSDYIEDGRLFCGKCRTAKETQEKFPCLCSCAKAAQLEEREQRRKQEEFDRVQRLRTDGISSSQYRAARFTDDDGTNSAMKTLREYVKNWEQMRDENKGLFLYGADGTGKTFGAACVANALIEQLVPVYMSTFSTVLNGLGETFEKMR